MKTFNCPVGSSNNDLLLTNPIHRVFHSGNHLFLCTNGWDVLEHLLYFGAAKSLCSRTASYVPTPDDSVLSNCIYRIGSSVFHKSVFLKNLLNRLLNFKCPVGSSNNAVTKYSSKAVDGCVLNRILERNGTKHACHWYLSPTHRYQFSSDFACNENAKASKISSGASVFFFTSDKYEKHFVSGTFLLLFGTCFTELGNHNSQVLNLFSCGFNRSYKLFSLTAVFKRKTDTDGCSNTSNEAAPVKQDISTFFVLIGISQKIKNQTDSYTNESEKYPSNNFGIEQGFSLRGLISSLCVQTKFYSSLGGPN